MLKLNNAKIKNGWSLPSRILSGVNVFQGRKEILSECLLKLTLCALLTRCLVSAPIYLFIHFFSFTLHSPRAKRCQGEPSRAAWNACSVFFFYLFSFSWIEQSHKGCSMSESPIQDTYRSMKVHLSLSQIKEWNHWKGEQGEESETEKVTSVRTSNGEMLKRQKPSDKVSMWVRPTE